MVGQRGLAMLLLASLPFASAGTCPATPLPVHFAPLPWTHEGTRDFSPTQVAQSHLAHTRGILRGKGCLATRPLPSQRQFSPLAASSVSCSACVQQLLVATGLQLGNNKRSRSLSTSPQAAGCRHSFRWPRQSSVPQPPGVRPSFCPLPGTTDPMPLLLPTLHCTPPTFPTAERAVHSTCPHHKNPKHKFPPQNLTAAA